MRYIVVSQQNISEYFMPKPLKFPIKLLIGFDDAAVKAIDDWRRQQEDLPNRSESVRRLVAVALSTRAEVAKSRRKATRQGKEAE
jgi:hypothetical protein